jgi:hypothetical protein
LVTLVNCLSSAVEAGVDNVTVLELEAAADFVIVALRALYRLKALGRGLSEDDVTSNQ